MIEINSEIIKALIRVLERDKPDLRERMRETLLEAADQHEAGGETAQAAELRELAGLGFFMRHR